MKTFLRKIVIALSFASGITFAAEPEFKPLFTDDDPPTGWITRHWGDLGLPAQGSPVWTVKSGVLVSTGDRGCWFVSDKDYGDFEIEYEFRLGPQGNSGFAFRAPAAGDPAFVGMEMQMADVRYNPQAKPSELTGGIYRAIAPKHQVYQPEQWNTVRLSIVGTKLKVEMNGKVIQDTDLASHDEEVIDHKNNIVPKIKDRPRRGRIGFQNLSRAGGQVEVRKARIRVFEPTPPVD